MAKRIDVKEKAELLDRQFKGKVIEVPMPIEQLTYADIMWLTRDCKDAVLIKYKDSER